MEVGGGALLLVLFQGVDGGEIVVRIHHSLPFFLVRVGGWVGGWLDHRMTGRQRGGFTCAGRRKETWAAPRLLLAPPPGLARAFARV